MSDPERLRPHQAAVSTLAVTVSLRGEGCTAFIFAEVKGRAVQASQMGRRWWLKFWGSRAGNASASELTVDTNEEAISAIADWLR